MAASVKLKSNFYRVPGAMDEVIREGVKDWLRVTEEQTKSNLTRQEAKRSYSLNTMYESITTSASLEDAIVKFGVWYAHFFEFGTMSIEPMPMLRPAKRKGDAAFKARVDGQADRTIRRRAGV
jgi:hypothetical protein